MNIVYQKLVGGMWEFQVHSETGRVSSYMVVIDEHSVMQASKLQGQFFTHENVDEVFILTLILMAIYIVLAILETPHVGLFQFM